MTTLPPLPKLSNDLLAESDAAHREVSARIDTLTPDLVGLVKVVLWQRLVESMAGVGAIEHEREQPRLVLPPRRRFLSGEGSARFEGVEMALRHVDTRLAMAELGLVDHVVAPETPMVLNAFAESRDPTRRETNAGSIRTGPATFLDQGDDVFRPPSAEQCRPLLTELVEVVRSRPSAHHLELGAWTAVLMFAIHPFIDGNGRTARLLFQAIHSADAAGRFDWGSIEGWATRRRSYVAAIQQALPNDEPDRVAHIRPGIFAEFAAVRSIEGARRAVARIDHIDELVSRRRRTLGDATVTYAFVTLERNVAPAELGELGPVAEHVAIAEELCAAGHVTRDRLGRYNPC